MLYYTNTNQNETHLATSSETLNQNHQNVFHSFGNVTCGQTNMIFLCVDFMPPEQ